MKRLAMTLVSTALFFNTLGASAQEALKKPDDLAIELGKLVARTDTLEKLVASAMNKKVRLQNCAYPTSFTHSGSGTHPADIIQNAWNAYDGRVTARCPGEQVIVGLDSVHHNHFEDRMTKYLCCSLALAD